MTYFIMAVIAVLSCLWMTRPLWGAHLPARAARRAANIAVYQSRANELNTEIQAGLAQTDQAQALQQELASRLLSDVQHSESDLSASHAFIKPAIAITLSAIIAAFAWYWKAGSWQPATLINQTKTQIAQEALQRPEVQALTNKLALAMEKDPNNAEGWALLGRSYSALNDYEKAASAYKKANALTAAKPKAEWLTDEGEALGILHERDLTDEPSALFEAALKVDPAYSKALWYGALAASQKNDTTLAQSRLTALSKQNLPIEIRNMVQARISELNQMSNAPAPAMADANASPVSLSMQISIAPELAGKIPADSVLFVFAKAASGPPMPLAVQKIANAKLPINVKLDDSMGVMPTMKLSQFDAWTITARFSQSGSVQTQSGDLQGQVEINRADAAKPITLRIDQVLP